MSRRTQYRALLNLKAVGEILERERPDIIESADPYQLGWKTLQTARMLRIPIVAFYHSHFPEAYFRGPAERVSERFAEFVMRAMRSYVRQFYNRFDLTLVPSAGLRRVLQSWGVTNTRQAALGVDTATFRPCDDLAETRDSLGIPQDSVLLFYVGRLAAEKNTQTLFDAFAALTQRCASVHLLVIGDGQQRDGLRQLRDDTQRVTWIPYCAEPRQLAQFYRAADLFVHPGVEETFGLVALEAQACGTSVVGIRGSFMDEVILHDQTDWAEQNSAHRLADAVERMAARVDLRELGAIAGVRVAERFAWPAVFRRLFAIYNQVI